jgi:DNA-binding transcriptional MerR regulator/methylmalonyl-CoA mutase cobalamin-binding subunit
MSQFPIRTISEHTGVPTTTLRAWERRYGLLKPSRTAKGHRLYSQQDIELVKNVVKLLKQNHTISEAIRLMNDTQTDVDFNVGDQNHWQFFCDRILDAIEHFNEAKLDRAYTEALSLYPIDMVTERVILPVLKTLGERWEDREAGIAEEHFFSAYLRNKLGARLHHEATRSRGKRVLVSCIPGEYHELGILLFCIATVASGYQVLYLGTDLPLKQIPYVVSRTPIDAVLLSGTNKDNWTPDVKKDLTDMIHAVDVPVLFGGDISEDNQQDIEAMGAIVLGSAHVSAMEKMENVLPAFG